MEEGTGWVQDRWVRCRFAESSLATPSFLFTLTSPRTFSFIVLPYLLPYFHSFPAVSLILMGADTRYSDTILLYGAVYMHAVYYTSLYYSLYCTLYKLYTIVDSNILCHTIIYTKRQAYYIDCKP